MRCGAALSRDLVFFGLNLDIDARAIRACHFVICAKVKEHLWVAKRTPTAVT
jgi:hypothetical protein